MDSGGTEGTRQDLLTLRSWMAAVGEIARAVNQTRPLPDLLDLIAAATCRLTRCDFCAVLLLEPDPPRLAIEGASGFSHDYVARVNLDRPIRPLAQDPFGDGPTSRAFRSLRPVVVPDIGAEPSFAPWADLAADEGYRSLLCVPLIVSGRALGVLNCYATTERSFPTVERSLVESLADEAAIAIEASRLHARERATIADLERRNRSLEAQRAVLQRTEALHRELMAVLLGNHGLPAIVETLSRLVGQPVRLHGPEVPSISGQADRPPGPPSLSSNLPPTVQDGLRRPPPRPALSVPVVLDEVAVGHLATGAGGAGGAAGAGGAGGGDLSLESLRLRALESGALAVALQLQRERTAQEVQTRLSGDLLGDVLGADETVDEWSMHRRATQLGHDLTRAHTVLVVRADPVPAHDPVVLQRRLLAAVQAAVQMPGPRPLVAPRNENVVVFWAPRPDAPHRDPRQIAREIQRHVRESLAPVTVSVAIGATCQRLQEYGSAYRVAAAALDLRRRTSSREAVLSLADLGVYRFLLQVRRPDELAGFAATLLDPLRSAERAALLPTLRSYLDHGMSVAETARALFVHVNTVAYRIRRIEETLGLDLHDPAVLVNLRFALMVDDVLRL